MMVVSDVFIKQVLSLLSYWWFHPLNNISPVWKMHISMQQECQPEPRAPAKQLNQHQLLTSCIHASTHSWQITLYNVNVAFLLFTLWSSWRKITFAAVITFNFYKKKKYQPLRMYPLDRFKLCQLTSTTSLLQPAVLFWKHAHAGGAIGKVRGSRFPLLSTTGCLYKLWAQSIQ